MKIKLSVGDRIGRIIVRIFLIIWSLIVLYPMFWALQTSFKTNKEFYQNIWNFPEVYHFENYIDAWNKAKVGTFFLNSLYVTVLAMIGSLFIVSLAAYALGRFNNRFTRFMSNYFLLAYMIPSSIALIAQFFLMKNLNLVNSLEGLSLKYIADSIPFSLFVLTGFFRTMPHELEESAEIDGAGLFRTFVSVMLPLAKPGVMTIAIFNFLGFWNEYVFALILMTDRAKYTISVGIANLVAAASFTPNWGMLFAACIIVMIPCIVLYCFFQRNISEGMTSGAVKG